MSAECPYRIEFSGLSNQKNALRVEIMAPTFYCTLRPRKDNFGRTYDVLRYFGSGGCVFDAALPCELKECPLNK